MPCDVIVAGAGPAGSLAALILARAGARVQMFDRARFPRPKLCGDTLNPGALRVLAQHIGVDAIVARSLPLDGMVLTGPGVSVRGTYGAGQHAHAIVRRDLDALLLQQALDAGVQFEDETAVLAPVQDAAAAVTGVILSTRSGGHREQHAGFVIAADGRESRLARAVGLTSHAPYPRRWAVGGYFDGVSSDQRYGEMHVRAGHYIGVAPVPGGLVNACLVLPHTRGEGRWRHPAEMLRDAIGREPVLADRFARARLAEGPHVLGPMAVDARAAGVPGMVLAGDAAGFIDPITGDGLRFALAGAALAAEVVGAVLSGACTPHAAAAQLAVRRREMFASKWRFNRAVRTLVASPAAITLAGVAARVAPAAFKAVVRYAGDAAG